MASAGQNSAPSIANSDSSVPRNCVSAAVLTGAIGKRARTQSLLASTQVITAASLASRAVQCYLVLQKAG